MLKRGQSLALRAGILFVSIYLLVVVTALALISSAVLSYDDSNHIGPDVAIALAGDSITTNGGALRLRRDGAFGALASQNPSLWVLLAKDGRRYSFGPVPPSARQLHSQSVRGLEFGEFRVPGVGRPRADSSIEKRDTLVGEVLIASGGVDPDTISFATTIRYFLGEGLLPVLLGVVAMGLFGMLLSLPLLTRALKRVAAESAAIQPDHPERRLEEDRAPRELVPLVRSFNKALERLANELVRRKRFIADMAHELRTPLAVVSLRIEALEESDEQRDLQRMVTRLSHLVTQMLDVERLSLAGQQQSPVNLGSLASDVIAELAPMAMRSGYDLSLVAPSNPVVVTGDQYALGRALGNLIGNAVAHGGGSGQIQVIVGEWRTIDVTDEGPGVAHSIQSTLFEPFCRERWDRDGCGLGLHLVREIMRSHGGDAVLLDSARGAAFRMEFPSPAAHPI